MGFGIRVDHYNPVHVYFTLFSGSRHSRGRCGESQCMRVDEFRTFCAALKATSELDVVTWRAEAKRPDWATPQPDNEWGYGDAVLLLGDLPEKKDETPRNLNFAYRLACLLDELSDDTNLDNTVNVNTMRLEEVALVDDNALLVPRRVVSLRISAELTRISGENS